MPSPKSYEYTTYQTTYPTEAIDVGREYDEVFRAQGWIRVWADVTTQGTFVVYRRETSQGIINDILEFIGDNDECAEVAGGLEVYFRILNGQEILALRLVSQKNDWVMEVIRSVPLASEVPLNESIDVHGRLHHLVTGLRKKGHNLL